MNHLLKVAFFTAFLTFSNTTLATNHLLASIEAANPEASPFEVLEKFFAAATEKAELSDFPLSTVYNKKCVVVSVGDTNIYNEEILYQASYTILGVPSRGPLFPGTPNKNQIVIGDLDSIRSESDRGYLAAHQVLGFDERSFKIINDYGSPEYPRKTEINIRKNVGLLVSQVIFNGVISQYSYCWQE